MPIVRFAPMQKAREVKPGATILAAATQCGIPLGQSCDGEGICGWCKVTVLEGRDHVIPPSAIEQKLMGEQGFLPDERAACLARVNGDIVVTTTYW